VDAERGLLAVIIIYLSEKRMGIGDDKPFILVRGESPLCAELLLRNKNFKKKKNITGEKYGRNVCFNVFYCKKKIIKIIKKTKIK